MEYRYDAVGRRIQKILHRHGKEAETVTFIWSGLRMVGESSSLTPERNTQYIYSEGSWEPLARVDSIGEQSDIFWYHTELNGLPERMTDEHGEVVWRGRFTTWGETERESVTGFQAVPQNLRFQGQYLDRETGLHYNLFRYYDPVGGRFTQVDPIGLAGGMNTYGYVGDPLTWVDPLGLSPCTGNHAKEINIVYRALTREDAARVAAGKSIQGKAMNSTWTAAEHVANSSKNKALQGGALKNSPWISTTKLKSVAEGYEGEHGIVAIDLNKVSSLKVQVWEHTPRIGGEAGLPYHRSIWAQEVTIFQEIPNSAIIGLL